MHRSASFVGQVDKTPYVITRKGKPKLFTSLEKFPHPTETPQDKLMQVLYNLRIVDLHGRVDPAAVKGLKFPSSKKLFDEVTKHLDQKRSYGYSWKDLLNEAVNQSGVMPDQLALCGSAAPYLMRKSGYTKALFESLLGDQVGLLPEGVIPKKEKVPDDFDFRVKVICDAYSNCLEELSGAVQQLLSPEYVEKFFRSAELHNRLTAIGVRGEKEVAVEFIFWQSLERFYLFVADDMQLNILKDRVEVVSSKNSWQAFIDEQVKVCRIENPKSVNVIGWLKLIAKRTKGRVLRFDKKQDERLEELLLKKTLTLDSKFWILLEKQLGDSPEYAFCYCVNALTAYARYYPNNADGFKKTIFSIFSRLFPGVKRSEIRGLMASEKLKETLQAYGYLLLNVGSNRVCKRRDGKANVFLIKIGSSTVQTSIPKKYNSESFENFPIELVERFLVEKLHVNSGAVCKSLNSPNPVQLVLMEKESLEYFHWLAIHGEGLSEEINRAIHFQGEQGAYWQGCLTRFKDRKSSPAYAAVRKRFLNLANAKKKFAFILSEGTTQEAIDTVVNTLSLLEKKFVEKFGHQLHKLYLKSGDQQQRLGKVIVHSRKCSDPKLIEALFMHLSFSGGATRQLKDLDRWAKELGVSSENYRKKYVLKGLIDEKKSWVILNLDPTYWLQESLENIPLVRRRMGTLSTDERALVLSHFDTTGNLGALQSEFVRSWLNRPEDLEFVLKRLHFLSPVDSQELIYNLCCKNINNMLTLAMSGKIASERLKIEIYLHAFDLLGASKKVKKAVNSLGNLYPAVTGYLRRKCRLAEDGEVFDYLWNNGTEDELIAFATHARVETLSECQRGKLFTLLLKTPQSLSASTWKKLLKSCSGTAEELLRASFSKSMPAVIAALNSMKCPGLLRFARKDEIELVRQGFEENWDEERCALEMVRKNIRNENIIEAAEGFLVLNKKLSEGNEIARILYEQLDTPKAVLLFMKLEERGFVVNDVQAIGVATALVRMNYEEKLSEYALKWALNNELEEEALTVYLQYGSQHKFNKVMTALCSKKAYDLYKKHPLLMRVVLNALYCRSSEDVRFLDIAVFRAKLCKMGLTPELEDIQFAAELIYIREMTQSSFTLVKQYLQAKPILDDNEKAAFHQYLYEMMRVMMPHEKHYEVFAGLLEHLENNQGGVDLGALVEYLVVYREYFPNDICYHRIVLPFRYIVSLWCRRALQCESLNDNHMGLIGNWMGVRALEGEPSSLVDEFKSATKAGVDSRKFITVSAALQHIQNEVTEKRTLVFEDLFQRIGDVIVDGQGLIPSNIYHTLFELYLDVISRVFYEMKNESKFFILLENFERIFLSNDGNEGLKDAFHKRIATLLSLCAKERNLGSYKTVGMYIYNKCRAYFNFRCSEIGENKVSEDLLNAIATVASVNHESLEVEEFVSPYLTRKCIDYYLSALKDETKIDLESTSIAAFLASREGVIIQKKYWPKFYASIKGYFGRRSETIPSHVIEGLGHHTRRWLLQIKPNSDLPQLSGLVSLWNALSILANGSHYEDEFIRQIWQTIPEFSKVLFKYKVIKKLTKESIHEFAATTFTAVVKMTKSGEGFEGAILDLLRAGRNPNIVNPYLKVATAFNERFPENSVVLEDTHLNPKSKKKRR